MKKQLTVKELQKQLNDARSENKDLRGHLANNKVQIASLQAES